MELIDRIAEIAEPVLKEKETELVDITYKREQGRFVLRLLVDRPGGITLDTCVQINETLSELLDTMDLIPTSYTLEVASPGLDRELRQLNDYNREIGKLVRVHTYGLVDGKRDHVGKLVAASKESVIVEDANGVRSEIPASQISKARLEVVL